MEMFHVVIILCLFIVVMIVVAKLLQKDAKGNEYDERQIAIQGKAFKIAYFVGTIGILFIGVLEDYIATVMQVSVALYAWIFITGLILVGYQIFTDAYFGLNYQKGSMLVCYAVIAITQFIIGISRLKDGSFFENGIVTLVGITPFLVSIFFTVFLCMVLIKKINERGEERE